MKCPYCHDELDSSSVFCGQCSAAHHNDCWAELKSCASCRCKHRGDAAPPLSIKMIKPSILGTIAAICFDLPLVVIKDCPAISLELIQELYYLIREILSLGKELMLAAKEFSTV